MKMKAKKRDPEFMELLRKCAVLNPKTGDLRFEGMYASTYINFGWKGSIVSVPHAHVVWFLTRGRWPDDDKRIDHIDDDAMNNAPRQELTEEQNAAKRRGRIVYRSYGSGKYPHGLSIYSDKRDGRHYVSRYVSRGYGKGDLKSVKKGLAGYDTLKEAEAAIARFVAEIEANVPDHMPPAEKKQNRRTIRLQKMTPKIRDMRSERVTIAEIARETGFCEATIHNVTKDMAVDRRRTR